ncbi:MAG TPA: serine hydrolase, partial [Rhodanobacteraceae bacterium]
MRRSLFSALFAISISLSLISIVRAATPLPHTPTVGQQREDTLSWSQAKRDADFRRMYRIFPSIRVDAGGHVHALPQGRPLQLADGQSTAKWIQRYMSRYHIAGVMVLQDGDIRLQRYAMGFGPNQRWTSYSVAKSVTSLLLGAALQQGYIHSMNDLVDRYLPLLRHT